MASKISCPLCHTPEASLCEMGQKHHAHYCLECGYIQWFKGSQRIQAKWEELFEQQRAEYLRQAKA